MGVWVHVLMCQGAIGACKRTPQRMCVKVPLARSTCSLFGEPTPCCSCNRQGVIGHAHGVYALVIPTAQRGTEGTRSWGGYYEVVSSLRPSREGR
jgi:hypothetical protein